MNVTASIYIERNGAEIEVDVVGWIEGHRVQLDYCDFDLDDYETDRAFEALAEAAYEEP